ncbi:hypothetical protein CD29_05250 [Ureibacillus manganicus DSM 26584]|uniref:Uncharacterized protein n=1 Tax=Ureibacillus manganicus DSM 26584 TaxID=1384049 RepID=A0A0A3I445_9BACL|nr:hypothetical protein CD29_05250 [Ureibacillus manganicus DSM 26584]
MFLLLSVPLKIFNRNAEGARPTPKATGETDKRALFALAGGFEVAEELAPEARHLKSGRRSPSFNSNFQLNF